MPGTTSGGCQEMHTLFRRLAGPSMAQADTIFSSQWLHPPVPKRSTAPNAAGPPHPASSPASAISWCVPPAKNTYAQKLREGVAPVTAVRYAGFWIRFLAVIIDGIIGMLASAILQYAVLGTITAPPTPPPGTPPDQALPVMLEFLGRLGMATSIGMAFDAVYQALFVHKLGGTPGKLALGLKVVRPNGGPIGLGPRFRPLLRQAAQRPHSVDRVHHRCFRFGEAGAARHDLRHACDPRTRTVIPMPVPCARCDMPLPKWELAAADTRRLHPVRRRKPGARFPGDPATSAHRIPGRSRARRRGRLLRPSGQAGRGRVPPVRSIRVRHLRRGIRGRDVVPIVHRGGRRRRA